MRPIIPMMVRTNNHLNECGDYNGYLAIPIEIWEKVRMGEDYGYFDYERMPDIGVFPHGGWTFGAYIHMGKHLSHLDQFIPLTDIRDINDANYFVIGFDTCHLNDNSEIWNARTVREHLYELYDALIEYIQSIGE